MLFVMVEMALFKQTKQKKIENNCCSFSYVYIASHRPDTWCINERRQKESPKSAHIIPFNLIEIVRI